VILQCQGLEPHAVCSPLCEGPLDTAQRTLRGSLSLSPACQVAPLVQRSSVSNSLRSCASTLAIETEAADSLRSSLTAPNPLSTGRFGWLRCRRQPRPRIDRTQTQWGDCDARLENLSRMQLTRIRSGNLANERKTQLDTRASLSHGHANIDSFDEKLRMRRGFRSLWDPRGEEQNGG